MQIVTLYCDRVTEFAFMQVDPDPYFLRDFFF
jgi:hypothetical protein